MKKNNVIAVAATSTTYTSPKVNKHTLDYEHHISCLCSFYIIPKDKLYQNKI